MLLGTFVNPETFVDEVGFYDGASARVVDMHLCRDVSKPDAAAQSEEERGASGKEGHAY
jgi:hypothetical protein